MSDRQLSRRQLLVVGIGLGEFGRVLSGRHPTLATVILWAGTTALRFFVSIAGLLRHQDLPWSMGGLPGRALLYRAPETRTPGSKGLPAGRAKPAGG